MINVNIQKNPNESASSVLRRFTKKVQESGVLNRVRSIKYTERTLSYYKTKKKALEKLKRQLERERLIKLGKLVVPTRR
ncbi:MAG TPA: 30S ribosomal protein S21 [Candidatus Paceibacterota bacterium]